jgi:glyoxylase-like metal-dependent hydrolase (beta-lactamase superfamily II)
LFAFGQDFSKIQVTSDHLAGNVHLIASRSGGNICACVGADGVLLVDSDYTQLAAKVEAAVAAICEEPVRIICNTHWHFDHVGGNEHFAEKGCVIVAHENVRKRMAKAQRITIIDVDVEASPPKALPVLTFEDSATFHCNGETVTALHFSNAHTDGDAVIHFKEANVIHTGDLVFSGGYPFIDLSSGGSIHGLIAALQSVLALCDAETQIVPGHGPLYTKAELESYVSMLQDFRAAIAKEIEAGKDLPAALAAKPTAELDKTWGTKMFPPQVFAEIVYRSLKD